MANTNSENSERNQETQQNQHFSDEKFFKEQILFYIEKKLNEDIEYFINVDTNKIKEDFKKYAQFDTPYFKKINSSFDYCFKILEKTCNIESQKRIIFFYNTQELFLNEFKLENEQKIKLLNKLKKQKPSELKILSQYVGERQKYIKKILGLDLDGLNAIIEDKNKDIDERLLNSIFGNLGSEQEIFEIKEKIKSNEETKLTLKKLINCSKIDLNNLKELLNLLQDKGKRSLIKYFLPTISLKDAIDILFDKEDEKKTFKEKEIKEILKNRGLSPQELEDCIKEIDLDSLFIKTDSLDKYKLNLLSNSEMILNKIVKEYNSGTEILTEEESINNMEDLYKKVNSSNKIKEDIKKDILKFKVGNYVNIFTKKPNGNILNNYFYVKEIKDEKIILVNITKGNTKIVKGHEIDEGKKDPKGFGEFYDVLTKISSKSDLGISFIDNQTFKKDIEENKIQEIPESQGIESKKDLEKFLNQVDPKGTGIFEEMAFYCDSINNSGNENNYAITKEVFIVDNIDNNKIKIRGQKEMELKKFAKAFEERKAKRFPKMNNVNKFFEELKKHENYKESLKDFEIEDNKIIPKSEKGNKKFPGIEYFVGPNGEAVHIKKLNDSTIDFEEGKFKEGEKNPYSGERIGKGFNYNTFFLYLSAKKLTPYIKPIETKTKEDKENIKEFKPKRSLLKSRWGSWLSIGEIMSGGKQVVSSIEQYLKTSNQLKSAKFALAVGKFLPKDIKRNLINIVETEEKKIMEEQMGKIKSLNPNEMIKTIEEILLSSKPKDPKLEAALMIVIGKYHTLYPKGLNKYKGKFMWYQALGGKIGDEMYMQYKMECENTSKKQGVDPVPFTEEYLVEELLKSQCRNNTRRNRFDKDYGDYRKKGFSEEIEDGKNKVSDYATLNGRMSYCIGEFKNLTYANGVGGMEGVWGKGPDPGYTMNTLPFVIMTSGMSMDFTQPLVDKVKTYGYTTAFSSLALVSSQKNVDMYNKYVGKVIEMMGDKEMLASFNEIQKETQRSVKIEKAYEFWEKYGKKLYPKINLHDGFVVSKMKDEGNEVFKDYFEYIKGVQADNSFKNSTKIKDDVEEGFVDIENSPIAATGGLISKVNFIDGGKYTGTMSRKLLLMYANYLKKVSTNEEIPIEKRKELFKEAYKKIERQIHSEIIGFIQRGGKEGYKSYACVIDARKMGVEVSPDKFTDEGENFLDSKYDEFLERKWKEFKEGKLFSGSNSDLDNDFEEVKKSIDDILSVNHSQETQNTVA